MDILRNPTTVKLLARQLIVACDAYISFGLTEKQLKELLFHYASHHPRKFFALSGKFPGSLNPTVINRIGKKRCDLILLLLEGFQMKMI
jgi:uncharacterized protein (TIGR04540 family)